MCWLWVHIKIFVASHSNEYLMGIVVILSSVNLYTFIRPNQEQKRKMQL